ncbi:MAG: hypothetical protein ACI9J2_002152 [Saprospiraceae bacterium]|jgi:hypothetical protein
MNKLKLLKAGVLATMLLAPSLYAQNDAVVLEQAAQSTENEQGLVVYEIKSQAYVESTVVHRGEGKLIDYYDQSRQDRSVFSDGELSASPQLRVWRLSR